MLQTPFARGLGVGRWMAVGAMTSPDYDVESPGSPLVGWIRRTRVNGEHSHENASRTRSAGADGPDSVSWFGRARRHNPLRQPQWIQLG